MTETHSEATMKQSPASLEKTGDPTSQATDPETRSNQQEAKKETAKTLLNEELKQDKIRKAKNSKNITSGICHILATFNNTHVTFSDLKGNVIAWSSSGKCNFRGSRKSTSYAAQIVTQDAGRKALSHGCKELVIKVRGPGMGRNAAIRTLQALGFIITAILEVTPLPHNGCRPRKRRRV